MKISNKIGAVLLLVVILLLGCNKAETASSVENINAQAIQEMIKANKGKVVFINFWATWCPPCRAEIPELVELRKAFSDDELVMIGVSVDSDKGAVDKFAKNEVDFNYPIYFAGDDVGSYFRIQSIPRNIIYAPSGERVFDKEGSFPGAMFENYIKKMLKDR